MFKQSGLFCFFILFIFIVLLGAGCTTKQQIKPTKVLEVAKMTIEVSMVQVSKFYDGRDGYSLSVPNGNTSDCIWTYAGGSGQIPYIETTSAKTSTEKHTIYFDHSTFDFLYDFKVTCIDDFGYQYNGAFPAQ
jgi:hypothetical protein